MRWWLRPTLPRIVAFLIGCALLAGYAETLAAGLVSLLEAALVLGIAGVGLWMLLTAPFGRG